jgi:F-type H+-transporting ATPase subunit epsilon
MSLPKELVLEIVTPDRLLVRETVDEVELPGAEGYLGILPGHTPLLGILKVGEMWYRKGTTKTYLSLAFGFVEVLPDKVTVLAQIAERAEDIDVARAEESRKRAEARLAKPPVDLDYERAAIALAKAMSRLQAAAHAGVPRH